MILKDFSFTDDEYAIADEMKALSRTGSVDSNIPDPIHICKICLSKLATLDNPFISPCLCNIHHIL